MRASVRAFCAIVLLAACSRPALGAGSEIDPVALQGIKKVGIVSLLPEVLEVNYVGNLAFDNFHYYGPVEWWNINGYVTSALAAQLKQRERFELKELSYNRAALRRRNEEANFLKPFLEVIQPDLAALATAQGVDAVFVILPGGTNGALCGNGCIGGYGNSGFGIYSVGSKIGMRSRRQGDDAYVSMAIGIVRADGVLLAQSQAAGSSTANFNRSNEFTGIPAPMLEHFERLIKGLVDKHLPDATARFALFNTAPPATASGDPKLMPTLKIDTACCPLSPTLAGEITSGYMKAAESGGLKVGEETAVLTVRTFIRARRANVFTPPSGQNRIDAVLEFRGNQYVVSEVLNPLASGEDVAKVVGEVSLEKVRAAIDPAAPRREHPPAIPKGPE